jgi:hypothetical protein
MDLELINIQQIVNKDTGEVVMSSTSSKDVPDLPEIEKSGFAAAFSELETAILETRKQTSTDIAEKYPEVGSIKGAVAYCSVSLTLPSNRTGGFPASGFLTVTF